MTEKKMSNKEKMEKLNKRINNNPDDAEAYRERAFLQKDENKEFKDLKQAIKLDPKNGGTIFMLARRAHIKNRFDIAIKYYKKIVESDLEEPSFKEFCLREMLEICLKQDKIKEYVKKHDLEDVLEINNLEEMNNSQLMEIFVKKYIRTKPIIAGPAEEFVNEILKKLAGKVEYGKVRNILNEVRYLEFEDYDIREDYLMSLLDEINVVKTENKVKEARIKERNKIIADLSHSIKNMLGTVIDPLENLKDEKEVRPNIINNAIRGANLIRQIVNAMNLSFKGSYDDFVYDAKNNQGKDAVSIERMILESIKHSLSNMFDSKYFGNFMRNYFAKKEIYQEAKSAWKKISDSEEVEDIETFANKYFFKTEFDLDSAYDFIIGNEKGSAIKLQILFQEIIFNAVKYTCFVDKKNRFLKIKFSHSNDKISFIVNNSYKPSEKTKTTGLGHVVIENFAKLLRTKPAIERTEAKYSLKLESNNFWK